jgi:hypothetical protein
MNRSENDEGRFAGSVGTKGIIAYDLFRDRSVFSRARFVLMKSEPKVL